MLITLINWLTAFIVISLIGTNLYNRAKSSTPITEIPTPVVMPLTKGENAFFLSKAFCIWATLKQKIDITIYEKDAGNITKV